MLKPRPDLSGALFVERSGTKKRERKAEIVAQKITGENVSETLLPASSLIY